MSTCLLLHVTQQMLVRNKLVYLMTYGKYWLVMDCVICCPVQLASTLSTFHSTSRLWFLSETFVPVTDVVSHHIQLDVLNHIVSGPVSVLMIYIIVLFLIFTIKRVVGWFKPHSFLSSWLSLAMRKMFYGLSVLLCSLTSPDAFLSVLVEVVNATAMCIL